MSKPRIIDCVNDYDSFWAHNGKSVFVFDPDELTPYDKCLAAIEQGFNTEGKQSDEQRPAN